MMEPSLLNPMTWKEGLWLIGLGMVFLLSLYVIEQFFKIIWEMWNE